MVYWNCAKSPSQRAWRPVSVGLVWRNSSGEFCSHGEGNLAVQVAAELAACVHQRVGLLLADGVVELSVLQLLALVGAWLQAITLVLE